MNIKSEYKTINGYKIHYLSSGSGEPLVLFHASFSNSETYRGLIEFLADKFTVYVPDFPGFGKSDPVTKELNLEKSNNLIVDWIKELKLEKYIIAGISLGCANIVSNLRKIDDNATLYLLIEPYMGRSGLKIDNSLIRRTSILSNLAYNYFPRWLGNTIWKNDKLLNLFLDIFDKEKNPASRREIRLKAIRSSDFDTFFKVLNYVLKTERLPETLHTSKPALFIMGKNEDSIDYNISLSFYKKLFPNLLEYEVNIINHYPKEPLTVEYFNKNFSELFLKIDKIRDF